MRKKEELNGKKIAIVFVIILLAVLCVVGVAVARGRSNQKDNLLELGQRYLDELNYEQAAVCFEEYLEIDPKSADAYIGLAEAYIGMEEYSKALDVLEKGYSATGDTYLDELISRIEEQFPSIKRDEDTVESNTAETGGEYYVEMNEDELKDVINEMMTLEPGNISGDGVVSSMADMIAFLYDFNDLITRKSILFSQMDEEDMAALEYLILHFDWYDPSEINTDDLSRVVVDKSVASALFDDFYCSGGNYSWDNKYLNDVGERVEFSIGDPGPDYILREKMIYENEQYILITAGVYDYWAEELSGEEKPLNYTMQILFYKNESSRYGMTALCADIQLPESLEEPDAVIAVTWDAIIDGNHVTLEQEYSSDGKVDIVEGEGYRIYNVELPEDDTFSLELFNVLLQGEIQFFNSALYETNTHVVIVKDNQIIADIDYREDGEDANMVRYYTGAWAWRILVSNDEVIW